MLNTTVTPVGYTCSRSRWLHNLRFWCALYILLIKFLHIQVATDVVQEQCEADADTSIQQRVLMGAGTAMQGTGEALCEEGEGNQDTKIAGGLCEEIALYQELTTDYIQ